MPTYTDEISPVGLKTVQHIPGAGIADSTLTAMLTAAGFSAAELANLKGIDIYVNAGTLYTTNDGSVASATSFPIGLGSIEKIRNGRYFLTQQMHVFAAAGIDLRIRAWKHGA